MCLNPRALYLYNCCEISDVAICRYSTDSARPLRSVLVSLVALAYVFPSVYVPSGMFGRSFNRVHRSILSLWCLMIIFPSDVHASLISLDTFNCLAWYANIDRFFVNCQPRSMTFCVFYCARTQLLLFWWFFVGISTRCRAQLCLE